MIKWLQDSYNGLYKILLEPVTPKRKMVAALVIGVLLGLLWAYVLQPVIFYDADPVSLHQSWQDEWVKLLSDRNAAANADVRFGTQHPDKDLKQNTIGTFNVLEAMRAQGVKKIAFSSTSSVYGEAKVIPTPEDCPMPVQTSLYAASKLAGEGLITSYCEGFGYQSWIFRFVSILGARYTHGHVFDFVRKLLADPTTLHILGNGKQTKSYMDVTDLLSSIITAVERGQEKVNIFNLGTGEACTVNQSVGWICERLGVSPKLTYAGGERGWIGDNPVIQLDPARIRALGWAPKYEIREGVERTVDWLKANTWALEQRH